MKIYDIEDDLIYKIIIDEMPAQEVDIQLKDINVAIEKLRQSLDTALAIRDEIKEQANYEL